MRIVELKSQNLKIIYKPKENHLKVGDFISFEENDLTLVAQIYKIVSSPAADDFNQADLIFVLRNQYGKTEPWNGEIISMEANVSVTDKNIIANYIKDKDDKKSMEIGNYIEFPEDTLTLNTENFSTPAFIGFEKVSDNFNLVKTIIEQFSNLGEKILVLDFKGNYQISNAKKIIAGIHSKLPLNSNLLENLCPKILEGVSLESKAVIEDIILEVATYAQENTNGFIPLSNFINVIDDIYKKSKISQLILLKNKLRRYQKLNIFADTKEEVYSIFNALESSIPIILDLSNIPIEWQKEFFANIIELNNKVKKEFLLFANVDEQNSDNKIINNLMFKAKNSGIKPVISSNYRYLSFENIFDFSNNTFLFKTYNVLKKRQNICDILQALPSKSFILNGKLSKDLIICCKLKTNETEEENSIEKSNTIEKKETIISSQQEEIANNFSNTPIASIDMSALNTALQPEPSIKLNIPDETKESYPDTNEKNVNNNSQNEITLPTEDKKFEEVLAIDEKESIIPEIESSQELTEENSNKNQPVQTEILEPTEIVELIEPEHTEENILKDTEKKEVIAPVNNLFEEVETTDSYEQSEFEEISSHSSETQTDSNNEDNLEDLDLDDLDFLNEVQDYNNSTQKSEDEDLLDLLNENDTLLDEETEPEVIEDIDFDELENSEQEISQKSKTPMQKLPIYNADYDQKESKEKIEFQEGDLVKHQKYGIGTIKKITAHGDKLLCHINFDDFGRRLLDPDISQLQKI